MKEVYLAVMLKINAEMHVSFHEDCQLSLTKIRICRYILVEIPSIKFHTNLFCGSQVDLLVQTGKL
jgi:hypothetical protein